MSEQLPQPQSGQDIMMKAIEPYLLNPEEDYPEPYAILEYNGIPFSPLGGIQAISGQKKNGKTFVLAQLMAAIVGHSSQRIGEYLPGLKIPERTLQYLREKHNNPNYEPKVLYVDTEMEKLNSAKVLRRVHWLCDWDIRHTDDRFRVMWMREITPDEGSKEQAYQKRYRLIQYGIEALQPDIVFIDGVRDIIGDFNDNAESSILVQSLMALASQKGISIWLALHMNPRPKNDDESKMRGHLGTELGNKVTDTLVVIKHKDKETGQISFTVQQQDARGKDMDDWVFEVTEDAGALGIPRIKGGNLQRIIYDNKSETDKRERSVFDAVQHLIESDISRSVTFTEITTTLKATLHVGIGKAKEYFNEFINNHPNVFYLNPHNHRWYIRSDEANAYQQGLPFPTSSDNENDEPF